MRSNSSFLNLNDPTFAGANATGNQPTQVTQPSWNHVIACTRCSIKLSTGAYIFSAFVMRIPEGFIKALKRLVIAGAFVPSWNKLPEHHVGHGSVPGRLMPGCCFLHQAFAFSAPRTCNTTLSYAQESSVCTTAACCPKSMFQTEFSQGILPIDCLPACLPPPPPPPPPFSQPRRSDAQIVFKFLRVWHAHLWCTMTASLSGCMLLA